MPRYIIKTDPDVDFYVDWSTIVEAPVAWGTREWMLPYLYDQEDRKPDRIPPGDRPEDRLQRADEHGTSAHIHVGRWDHEHLVYEQRGLLPRRNLAALCDRLAAAIGEDGTERVDVDVMDLLEPFGDPDLDGDRWAGR